MNESATTYCGTDDHEADLFTKVLPKERNGLSSYDDSYGTLKMMNGVIRKENKLMSVRTVLGRTKCIVSVNTYVDQFEGLLCATRLYPTFAEEIAVTIITFILSM